MDWAVTILLASAFFTAVSVNYVISPVLPSIARSFGISISEAGILVSVYSLTYACSAIAFGPVSDLIGRKNTMEGALVLFGVMSFLCGQTRTFGSLVGLRAASGVAAALLQPATWGYLGDYFEYGRRGTAAAWVMQAGSLALILGAPLGGVFAFYFDWHGIFIVASVIALAVAGLVAALLPSFGSTRQEDLPQHSRNLLSAFKGSYGSLISSKVVRGALLVSFLIWFGFQGLYTYLGAFLDRRFGLDSAQIGLVTIALGVGYVAGGQLGGRLADRVGAKTVVLAGLIFEAAILGVIFRSSSLVWAALLVFAMGFGFFFSYSAQVTLITELRPIARGSTMAANYFFTYLGLMAGTVVGGVALARYGFAEIGLVSALACTMAATVAAWTVFEKKPASRGRIGPLASDDPR